MTIDEALAYIHSVDWMGSRPGLDRTRELLRLLGDPQKKLKFVHVAGTNGKGSTCACIASILQKAGYKTGLYTSPYINVFNERIQINRQMISDGDLADLTGQLRPLIEAMPDKPTEFERITALALKYFADAGCDIVVLEVGMGGELDSTNVIDPPEVAVITALGLDHTKILGPTLRDIARAKAGIIKPGSPVVCYGGTPEADDVIAARAADFSVPFTVLDRTALEIERYSTEGCTFSYREHRHLTLPLIGTYQPYNAALAIEAAHCLQKRGWNLPESAIVRGLAEVDWAGRFEILGRDPVFVLDGAHNPHGMTATAASIRQYFTGRKLIFLTGVMADKDVRGIYSLLAPMATLFLTVRPDNPRAMAAEQLAELLRESFGVNARPCPSVADGVKTALEAAGKNGVVCALGSLYFSGDVRRAYQEIRARDLSVK